MRGMVYCAALLAAAATYTPAFADCSTEVALGVTAQGKQKFIRTESMKISEIGPLKVVAEYATPDRMRQTVTTLADNKTVETVVVESKAWTNTGDGWKELPPAETDEVLRFMSMSVGQVYRDVGKYECTGTETIDGRELRGYRSLPEEPKDLSPKAPDTGVPNAKNEAVRIVYLDPKTGLPARSIFARSGMLDKPIMKDTWSYPESITIEAPKVDK